MKVNFGEFFFFFFAVELLSGSASKAILFL